MNNTEITEEEMEELRRPLVPDKDFHNTNLPYKVFFYIIIPITCTLLFIGLSFLSIKFKTPNYLFFGLLLLWFLLIYPIYF